MSVTGTLGVEEELQLLEPRTGALAPSAPRLLRRLPSENFSAELQRSTVEMNTSAATSLEELRGEILRLRAELRAVASDFGLQVVAVGMVPQATDDDFELTMLGRFSRMHEEYRLLVDEQLICGYQVHVGVTDADLAVRLAGRVTETLPTLLALSASSPFWRGRDTGYASMRTMIWQRWPTSGGFGPLSTMEAYQRLVDDLVDTGVISDAKMAYFDVRPSQHVPTLELRICDACPLVDDAVLIAGLFRAAVAKGAEEEADGPPSTRPMPVQRAALWRAARSGLSGELLGQGSSPRPRPAAEVVDELLWALRPQLEAYGDWEVVNELAGAALARGCSAARQRSRFAERGRMADVVDLLVEETASHSRARPRRLRTTADYPASVRDEAVTLSGAPTAPYRRVFEAIDRLSEEELERRSAAIAQLSVSNGLTFGVAGEQRPFPLDLVPRIVPAHQWSALAAGLTQRARAIEAFLRDIYGPARIVADGVLEPSAILASPGWREEGRALPPGVVRAAVIGFDLVHEPISGWRVLEDNVRVPSGVGYAVGIRRVLTAVSPELGMGVAMRSPDETIGLLGRTLRRCARPEGRADPVVALISDGSGNSAWYEHQILAEGAELLLAEPNDVTFEGGRPAVGGHPLDVAYLRLECELADLVDSQGRAVGRGILDAAERGEVALVNTPGNGVADDKSVYCHIPDVIGYYLGESPLIAQVPTYRCSDPAELEIVLDRLDELVTKPVDGYGGGGVLIGADADPALLEERRRALQSDPDRWVAQETMSLSTLPTVSGTRLEPRHVDLRTFVYLTGTGPDDAELAGLALTRVAPAGSMIVNSSRGGGAKDTWILTSDEKEAPDVRYRR